MLDVATLAAGGGEIDADLAVFVDRLAAAGSDRPTASARAQILRSIATGDSPPGLRTLAEALAATVTGAPPPRRPSEDPASVVSAMGGHALVVLEQFGTDAVAGAIAALVADGRRVVITGSVAAELAAVREALPSEMLDRVVDELPALSPSELRELRRLLATSTATRRARAAQQLPHLASLPPTAEVADLCARAQRPVGQGRPASLVPTLLAELTPDRRDAVVSVARCVHRSLGALHPRAQRQWAWTLLADLTFSRHRSTFDRLLEDTAQAVAALDRAQDTPPVTVGGHLPADGLGALRRFREFLETGGRARPYFRPAIQREVAPVLRLVRYDGRTPDSGFEVGRVIDHLELGGRLTRIDAGCAEVGIPAPRDEFELRGLAEGLVQIGAAARSVGALRHDVLFIAPASPLSVPDAETAEQVADAILDFAEHGSAEQAGQRLDRMAEELAGRAPIAETAPEHELLVAALRARDASVYATGVELLGAAHREQHDEVRRTALLGTLAERSPRLAAAWAAPAGGSRVALGLMWFVSAEALLSAVPASDSADIIVVLGSDAMGVDRLLLAAGAPRMIAVSALGEQPSEELSMLGVLRRAAALVIRGGPASGGRVVAFAGAQRTTSVPLAEVAEPPAPVGQAGA